MNIAACAYAGCLMALGLFVFWGYFSSAVQAGLAASVLFSLVTIICTGCGRLALRLFDTRELSESEKTLIGCSLGLGILANGMLLLGAAGALRPWAGALLLSALWVLGFTEMRDTIASLGANRNLLLRDRAVWTGGLLLLLGLSFWTTWVPPHQYDALVYHLPLAAAYIRSGSIAPVEHLIYSHFPQNGEMLFSLGLLLGSDLLAQMFSWLALVLSAWWVFEMGKREMPATAALLACALVAAHTSVMLLAAAAYVETFVMLWITAAVLSYCRWSETAQAGSRRGWLLLSGIFAGLGVGTKYTAGACPAILALLLAARWIWLAREGAGAAREGGRDAACFVSTAAAAGCPWLIKNWILLGNPVFPFLYRWLPHRGVPWAAENAARYFRFLTEYGHPPGQFFRDIFLVHYRAVSGSVNVGGGMDVIGILGWAVVFGVVPAAFYAGLKNRTLRFAGLYCGLHWAVWFSSVVVLRFLTAIVPLVCLAGAAGLYRIWEALGARARALLGGALGLLLACNLGLFLYVHTVFTSWNVLLGLESRDEFLSRMLDYYPCARWSRDHLGKNDKILIVGDQRSFHVAQEAVATTPMAPNRFVEWANQAGSSSELARLLKSEGRFTHLLVVPREAARLGGYGVFSFTEPGYKNWTGLENGALKRVYSGPYCSLFQLQ